MLGYVSTFLLGTVSGDGVIFDLTSAGMGEPDWDWLGELPALLEPQVATAKIKNMYVKEANPLVLVTPMGLFVSLTFKITSNLYLSYELLLKYSTWGCVTPTTSVLNLQLRSNSIFNLDCLLLSEFYLDHSLQFHTLLCSHSLLCVSSFGPNI